MPAPTSPLFFLPFCLAVGAWGQSPDLEFFEKNVRPVLVEKCQGCHGPTTEHSGLRVDSRAALLKGGARGPSLVPGQPAGSLLLRAIRHEELKMPLGGKLSPEQIRAFTTWIENGAAWPTEIATRTTAKSMAERAKEYWAFQPVSKPALPNVSQRDWPRTPVDFFVLNALEKAKLTPAAPADRSALIRRVTFDLTGLPPKPEEVSGFLADPSPQAYEKVVDRLLESPRFGEQWARHWMDLVRYSESHGSQGDFDLPFAWRYRDYLIRALNQNEPYDQLVREHLAGDLLAQPRINREENVNESVIGTAHFRMVEYGYVPVDALDDQFKVVDNQIDVISKAFQGLTVSCARCHDHKFDPISQKDFYALYGILASSRHGQRAIDAPADESPRREEMAKLRAQLRGELGRVWLGSKPNLSAELAAPPVAAAAPGKKAVDPPKPDYGPLQLWRELKDQAAGESFAAGWERATGKLRQELEDRRRFNATSFQRKWKLDEGTDYTTWFRAGNGLPDDPTPAGEFFVFPDGDRLINGVYQAGVFSHLRSRKDSAVLHSPRFKIESDSISLRVLGGNVASARIVVENYALGNGGIFPATNLNDDQFRWIRFDTKYRRGSYAYIELTPYDDRSRLAAGGPTDGRSHFGVTEVVSHDGDKPPKEEVVAAELLLDGPAPATLAQLSDRYQAVLRQCVEAWIAGKLTARQAAFLDFFARNDLLPNSSKQVPAGVLAMVERYRQLESRIPVPRRAPGLLVGTSFDQALFVRGSHMNPGATVPRRFLEALGSQPCGSAESGRLELANAIANAANPLTSRVMVNRIWHHLFGRGIVGTVDNFGKNGEKPSHPELLDYLATRFVEEGWSIKAMVRLMVTSSVYQLSSTSSAASKSLDSGNVLLQHARWRRLTAESIRDSILSVSGELEAKLYGPGIDVYYTGKTEGGGKVGPLDGARRRSVYQRIKRNAQNPFLEVFDSPKPTSTRGQRDSTNVPAQSLTMLNDPFVIDQASKWAGRMVADGATSARDRIERMFLRALGRRPTAAELAASVDYLAQAEPNGMELLSSQAAWQDLAHSIFNFKEFLYLQ
ncbi:MAG: PSD1 and planctomycete cytochrome C domain-containing protein [Acidobacteria bacterium]|nr:PSD1 and planctomycete cytochrome C domain-containing protein [Acidobacteriota bacterium]